MMRSGRSLLVVLVLGLLSSSLAAQEPIRLARTPDISPDGKFIAFSYLGDIWTVETIGGVARPITVHRAHDVNPVFSPDGHWIAFSSNRHGSYNVYVIPVQSGKPRRLTFDSGNDLVTGWSPDGKSILFASTRGTAYPPSFDLYTVPIEGGMAHKITAAEGKEGSFAPTGDRLAYVRGPGSWYRKGYRGSSNDDLWVCNADGTNNRQLTVFNGQDNSPMWSADGQNLYYVTEHFGTPANIVCVPVESTLANPLGARPRQITFHKEDGVRRAHISGKTLNGDQLIVYECGADLWVVSTREGSQPRKLAIEVHTDDKGNTERLETFTRGASEFAIAPDEKHVAIAVHGELFLMPIGPNPKATRLTQTAADNHGMAWAPDGNKLLFISDRDGQEDLYLLQSNDPEHSKLVEAHQFKTTRLTNTREAEQGASFSPDGKHVTFIRSGKLWSMKPDGSDTKVIVNDVHVFDYEWSPDSRWLVYARRDGSFASELYIVPAGGPTAENPARNVTRYATFNGGVTWSADGKKLAFLSDRRGSANLYTLSLQKPAAPGVTEKPTLLGPMVDIDWEDIHLRAHPVVPIPALEAAISPDGSKVAFRGLNQGDDLWVVSTTGGPMQRLTTGSQRPKQIQWSKRKSPFGNGHLDLIYFLDGNGSLRMVRANGGSGLGEESPRSRGAGAGNEAVTLPFKVKMTVKAEEEYSEMFEQSWRYLADNFYDAKFHGSNWDAVREKYRPLVKHVAMKEDLYSLLYLMMGELNASHLGVSGLVSRPEEETADLGLIFDETYKGRGLKIAEILKRGPADKRGLNLKPGDVVTHIDGVEITEKTDLSLLLNGKVDDQIQLTLSTKPGADLKDPRYRKRVEVQGASRDRISSLMYDRWVEHNAKRVAELSGGKLGYIHIPNMEEAGLDRFVRSLYSDNFDKEAIVLDVRYNGGGFTHDQVLNYLGAREHTFFRQRDGGEGLVLRATDRKWTRPLVLLINNRSYSDAEIFPNAFRTLGLGKLVGQPTGGFVIGTGSVRLLDGSTFRIPRIGVYTTKGVNMDKEGVMPDVLVEPHPDQLAKGVDAQLDKAVEVLKEEVVLWKKKHAPTVAAKPEASKPASAATSTAVGPMPPAKD
jgi:tricorn protease